VELALREGQGCTAAILCARWAVARRFASETLHQRWQQCRQALLMVCRGIDLSSWRQLIDDLWQVLRKVDATAGSTPILVAIALICSEPSAF
jgi:hypothetical protein